MVSSLARRTVVLATALLAITALGCDRPAPPEDVAWAAAVTSAVSQINDVVALDLVPALVDDNGSLPDFEAMLAACNELGRTVDGLRRASAAPPSRFERAAELARQLYDKWTEVVPRCQEAAAAKDMQRYKQLDGEMYELRDLTEELGDEIERQLR